MEDFLARIPQVQPPKPRDSALGILLRRGEDGLEVFFGRRARKSRFMPGHLAFPGGGMDAQDEPGREGAYARCASRELQEETGIQVAPESWIDVGERITPPMFPVRFRTRFFVAWWPDGASIPSELPSPEEIDELSLREPAAVLEQWRRGKCLLPPPCLPMLRELADADPATDLDTLAASLRAANDLEQRFPRIEFGTEAWVVPVRTRTIPPATHTNVWMPGGERFVVIDPGSTEDAENERLLGVVRRRCDAGAKVEAVLLTHHHPDHIGGAARLSRELGVEVRAHRETLDRVDLEGCATATLEDDALLDLGGVRLRALWTPGHAPGHLAFAIEGTPALISGDLVSGFSTILVPPQSGQMTAFLDSLRRVLEGGFRKLLPAHGPPLAVKQVEKVLEHRLMREGRVRDALSAEWSPLNDLASRAYADVPETPEVLAQMQAQAHLMRLEELGEAESKDGGAAWRTRG